MAAFASFLVWTLLTFVDFDFDDRETFLLDCCLLYFYKERSVFGVFYWALVVLLPEIEVERIGNGHILVARSYLDPLFPDFLTDFLGLGSTNSVIGTVGG